MEPKSPSTSAAELLARLKTKPVKPRPRVPIEALQNGDGRRSRRQSTCLQAAIKSDRLAEPVDCAVRDMSANGARVEIVREGHKAFVPDYRIPDRFTLSFRLEKTEVDCEMIWRRGDVIGVRFISLHRHV